MRLPGHIIKKYGVSKKAWAVFRAGRGGGSRPTSRGGTVARKKKGGFKRGGSKPTGALLAVGGVILAGLAGYGAAELARNTVGARGAVKHFTGLVVGGLPGAAGSVVGDMLAGRGFDISLTMPSIGQPAAATPTAQGPTFG